jgi:NAD(P)-dependent dehydrogenase (short-subunit alcohol dehydrogenase family)
MPNNRTDEPPRTAIVVGISADIGRYVADRLMDDGWIVYGVARTSPRRWSKGQRQPEHVFDCDFSSRESIAECVDALHRTMGRWDLVFSAVGTMKPIGPFFSTEFDAWRANIEINVLSQLEFLHAVHDLRADNSHVGLLAGGGTNGRFDNYSAYCVSKIALIKMVELLHYECEDMNSFIIGPGFVKTKIHQETLDAGELAGPGASKTVEMMTGNGTPLEDVYQHLRWCMDQGRAVAGGRNHSTVHDPWQVGSLESLLQADPDRYRLRRYQGFEPSALSEIEGTVV